MKIGEIICGYKGKYARRDVSNLAFRLEKITENTLFFNLKNDSTGIEAAHMGAIVVEENENGRYQRIGVKNVRKAFSLACKSFYNNASDKLTLLAVTGTNGKTTTASILRDVLRFNGISVALIGTNGVYVDDRFYPPTLTTPDPDRLHAIFDECVKSNVTHVVMEASAHALELYKLEGLKFTACGFTNLTRDHLDFFGDMERYANAKLRLFDMTDTVVSNVSDSLGRKIIEENDALSYGIDVGELRASNLRLTSSGSFFTAVYHDEEIAARLSLLGEYNVLNALCAMGMAIKSGLSFQESVAGVANVCAVAGRMNVIKDGDRTVIVDFAHTDDGLKNLLSAVRSFTKGKIVTVFGCGGNRDKEKRPLMGRVASENSDVIIITSDNPRFEKPIDVIRMIEKGIKGKEGVDYFIEEEREAAIRLALSLTGDGDSVVIAGKGAENYMEINGTKRQYNDMATVEMILRGDIK